MNQIFPNLLEFFLKPISVLKLLKKKECVVPTLQRMINSDQNFSEYMEKKYNKPQALAINSTLKNIIESLKQSEICSPFTLIQGPPGTGKTYTGVRHLNTLFHYAKF